MTTTVDAEGNQTEIVYPSGFEAHRTFDELNRLTLLEDSSSNDIASWTRCGAANRRDVLSYENGTTTTWGWDGFRRPTTITHEDSGSSYPPASPTAGCVALLRAAHAGSDNPTLEARSHQRGKGDTASTRLGTYDRANRLTKVIDLRTTRRQAVRCVWRGTTFASPRLVMDYRRTRRVSRRVCRRSVMSAPRSLPDCHSPPSRVVLSAEATRGDSCATTDHLAEQSRVARTAREWTRPC